MKPYSNIEAAAAAKVLEEFLERQDLIDWKSTGLTGVWAERRKIGAAVQGQVTVDDRLVTLRVGLPVGFPALLPVIAVDPSELGLELPHVEADGKVCFAPSEGLVLDRRDQVGVVVESYRLAIATLGESFTGNRAEQFAREIHSYIRDLKLSQKVECAVKPSAEAHLVRGLFGPPPRQGSDRKQPLWAVADDPSAFALSFPGRRLEEVTERKAIYIPIAPATDPDFVPAALSNLSQLRKYVAAACLKQPGIEKRLKRLAKAEEYVVLGIERIGAERALLGVQLCGPGGRHPLLPDGVSAEIKLFKLDRRDREFLIPRGGGDSALSSKRVLVAGCGAVGGHVALALARAGVGHLSLVDSDVFELANAYRHVCGVAHLGKPKVEGLRAEILRLIPYVQVEARNEQMEVILRTNSDWLMGHDLVVSAMGEPAIELELNHQLRAREDAPPALYAWVEPLGLGGHALLTHTKAGRGCLQCVYAAPLMGGPIVNRAAFAQQGVDYSRDALGCGGQFVPFADLDSQRTAGLCVRLALKAMVGSAAPTLRSWRGERSAFEEAGHRVTKRFETVAVESSVDGAAVQWPDCLECGRQP